MGSADSKKLPNLFIQNYLLKMSEERTSTRSPRRAHEKSKRLRAHVDEVAMTVSYGRVKLGVPNGFKQCLENVTREILRDQPKDIPAYLALYFTELASDQKSGMHNSNLVTKRIVEVNTSASVEIQKDTEKAETAATAMETQDIEDSRSINASNSEPVIQENKKQSELSFEEKEALNRAALDESAVVEENVEEEAAIEAPVVNEEQQAALDLLNHAGEEVVVASASEGEAEENEAEENEAAVEAPEQAAPATTAVASTSAEAPENTVSAPNMASDV